MDERSRLGLTVILAATATQLAGIPYPPVDKVQSTIVSQVPSQSTLTTELSDYIRSHAMANPTQDDHYHLDASKAGKIYHLDLWENEGEFRRMEIVVDHGNLMEKLRVGDSSFYSISPTPGQVIEIPAQLAARTFLEFTLANLEKQ